MEETIKTLLESWSNANDKAPTSAMKDLTDQGMMDKMNTQSGALLEASDEKTTVGDPVEYHDEERNALRILYGTIQDHLHKLQHGEVADIVAELEEVTLAGVLAFEILRGQGIMKEKQTETYGDIFEEEEEELSLALDNEGDTVAARTRSKTKKAAPRKAEEARKQMST